MPTNQKTIAVVLPEKIYEELTTAVQHDYSNVSAYVRELIKKDLRNQRRRREQQHAD